MIDKKIISKVAKYCIDNIDFEERDEANDYYYSSMPFCVIDSVFSIGVRYEGVINVIERFCEYYEISQRAKRKHTIPKKSEQISTTAFLKLFGNKTPKFLADNVFQNKQRTSTNNGILKSEAVLRFLKILKDFQAESYQDIPKLVTNEYFEACIKNIPGQRSGISLKYFFMLAGTDDLIKPDRMVIRFLKTATGQTFTLNQCQHVLAAVTKELNKKKYTLTPKLLDNFIWNYQRLVV